MCSTHFWRALLLQTCQIELACNRTLRRLTLSSSQPFRISAVLTLTLAAAEVAVPITDKTTTVDMETEPFDYRVAQAMLKVLRAIRVALCRC